MPTLRPCPSCDRHVVVAQQRRHPFPPTGGTEGGENVVVQSNRCPFCDGELTLDSTAHVLPGRVYRATRFATPRNIVAIATAAALACGGTTGDPNDAGKDQASDAADASAQDGTMDTGTGDTGVSDSGRDAVEEDSGIALPYGAPPFDGRKKRIV